MTKQNLRKRSVLLSYIPCGYESYERTLYHLLTVSLGEFEDAVSFKSKKGHIRVYVIFRTSKLAQLAISLEKVGIAGLEQHININELQNKDLYRLNELLEARISHAVTEPNALGDSALHTTTTAIPPMLHPVDQEISALTYQRDMLSHMLQEAQAQKDATHAALEVSQQELAVRNQQLEMKEMELKSQHQRAMDDIDSAARWRALFDREREQLEQELTAAREKIRLSNDAIEAEMARRIALERQLEPIKTREQIQPELLKALLSVDTIAQQVSQAAAFQHLSMPSAPINLADSPKYLFKVESPDALFTGEPKRRRLA